MTQLVLLLVLQVVEWIKRQPRQPPPGGFIPETNTLQGALALENVVFSYPARPTLRVLNGLSLNVNPGEWGSSQHHVSWAAQ